jgi:hypothetical protein
MLLLSLLELSRADAEYYSAYIYVSGIPVSFLNCDVRAYDTV